MLGPDNRNDRFNRKGGVVKWTVKVGEKGVWAPSEVRPFRSPPSSKYIFCVVRFALLGGYARTVDSIVILGLASLGFKTQICSAQVSILILSS